MHLPPTSDIEPHLFPAGPGLPSVRGTADGLGMSVVGVAFGLVFVGMGCYALVSFGPTGLAPQMLLGALLALLFGLMIAWGSVERTRMFLRFGRPRADVIPALLSPGDHFCFRYRQPLRRAVEVDLTIALVLRETITTRGSDGPETRHRDHAVRLYEEKRLPLKAGESLEAEHEFQIPKAGAGAFSVGEWPLTWVLKVRVSLKRGLEFWEEYRLPVVECPEPASQVMALSEVDPGHDVVLIRGGKGIRTMVRITQAMLDVMPHLSQSQAGDLYVAAPITILENVERERAEIVRGALEAAGATVEVRRGGDVVERLASHRLPIPHDGTPLPDALPIPAPADPDAAPRP
jgi:hypothetical protein